MFDDLLDPDTAHIVGLLQTDGSHQGAVDKKGKVVLEISSADIELLHRISNWLPCHSSVRVRRRKTNFRDHYESAALCFFDQRTRQSLAAAGVPPGRKSAIVRAPEVPFSRPDYVRGLLDGDGSVGFTAKGYPFVSFVTASPHIASFLCGVVHDVCGVVRTARPNTRDSVFNVMVTNRGAVKLASWAWYPGAHLSLERKALAASSVAEWEPDPRKLGRYGVKRTPWTPEHDAVIRSTPVQEAARRLGRTKKSVVARKWRLSQLEKETDG